ncbi:MAG TPA: nuclear transport factor 2 family protein [Methylophilaceae bacterium]|jgi:ketosteroid isomerase-like protein
MLTETTAKQFAQHWVQAWNSLDLDEIISHYTDDVVITSPVAKALLGLPNGEVKGKDALHSYFKRALEAHPDLRFELKDVMWGISSVVLYYVNHKGTHVGEFMELDASGKVVRMVANYGS